MQPEEGASCHASSQSGDLPAPPAPRLTYPAGATSDGGTNSEGRGDGPPLTDASSAAPFSGGDGWDSEETESDPGLDGGAAAEGEGGGGEADDNEGHALAQVNTAPCVKVASQNVGHKVQFCVRCHGWGGVDGMSTPFQIGCAGIRCTHAGVESLAWFI